MEDIKAKNHMSVIYHPVDDNGVSLWLETAGLIVFLSLVFWVMVKLF